MKYVVVSIIAISVLYTGIKLTEKLMKLIDKFFDYWEERKNKK